MFSRCIIIITTVMTISHLKPIPIDKTVRLLEIGEYKVGYRYFDEEEPVYFPIGWMEHFDENTGVSYTEHGTQNGKSTLLIHSPWRGGVGIAFAEYLLKLPDARTAKFEFATALRSDVVGKSDGVTYRVYINDQKMLEEHRVDDRWTEHSFSLAQYAGGTVNLRLEVHPGPKHNSSWDFSYWGDARVVLEGESEKLIRTKSKWNIADNLQELKNRGESPRGCMPTTAGDFQNFVEKANGDYLLKYEGRDCKVTYTFTPTDGFLNKITCQVSAPDGEAKCQFNPFVGAQLASVAEGTRQISTELAENSVKVDYEVGDVNIHLKLSIHGKSLAIETKSDEQGISAVKFGQVGAVPFRKIINVPYLHDCQVFYLEGAQLYTSTIIDWSKSNASSLTSNSAVYGEKTDGTRNLIEETAYFTVSPNIGEVLPNIPHKPSPYIEELSKRILVDVWGGNFRDDSVWLEELAIYGLTNLAIIKHIWQRSGYDNALPNTIPANPDMGGDEGMKHLVNTVRELGYLIALHENYIDYYPNSDVYDEANIARNADGSFQKAWYNQGTQMQSYALKPSAILKFAKEFSPAIHRRYNTNASYLDVHTCVTPWFHVDFAGSGSMRDVRETYFSLFAFIRKTHEGPFWGEGNRHFYWAGYCDGTEAQVVGGENAQLLLDFDLLKIHPQMVNHGMGYLERWFSSGYSEGWWIRVPSLEEMDKYRATELAYGHQGFIANQIWRIPSYAIKEYYLMLPVQQRYIDANPVEVSYLVDDALVPASIAVPLGQTDQIYVRYDSGLELWVNRNSKKDWHINGYELPPSGFLAKGAGVLAYTARMKNGLIADYSESGEQLYVDARSHTWLPNQDSKKIKPTIGHFKALKERAFEITYQWKIDEQPDEEWRVFVHFTHPDSNRPEKIVFQTGYTPSVLPSKWRAKMTVTDGPHRVEVPPEVEDGEYQILIGLWNKTGRMKLVGKDADSRRYLVGTVTIQGDSISFEPYHPTSEDLLPGKYLKRVNVEGRVVDFGKIRTNGSIIIKKDGKKQLIIPYPRGEKFQIELSEELLEQELAQTKVVALDSKRTLIKEIDVEIDKNTLTFETSEKACYYLIID